MPSRILDFPVFDADNHMYETPEALTKHLEDPFKGVIDYIDMDEKRNNRVVERKLKDALKSDRARIQVGRISHFGLMEMSRQRIRTSVLESSTETCPHCGGTGHVRSVSSVALQLLRQPPREPQILVGLAEGCAWRKLFRRQQWRPAAVRAVVV